MTWPLRRMVLALMCVAGLTGGMACSSGRSTQEAEKPRDVVIVDDLKILKDGEEWSFKLDAGTYKVELTASGDGASVSWVGSSCPGSGPRAVQTFSTICEMPGTGQLLVRNPSSFGMGQSVSITLKVTKLAR